MNRVWYNVIIRAVTDFIITSGTAWMAISSQPVTKYQVITILVGGSISAARTVQQAIGTTPEMAHALSGTGKGEVNPVVDRPPNPEA